LIAVEVARTAGIDNQAAVVRLLQWTRWHSEAHRYGTDRSAP
jgi:hypothetical protein